MTRFRAAVSMLLPLVLLAPGCGERGSGSGRAPRAVRVLAASSLTEAFAEIERRFAAAHPEYDVELSFAGSAAVAQQVAEGGPVDAVATADGETMDRLVGAKAVGDPSAFARNRLALLVEKGNPLGLRSLADLDRPGVKVVLCNLAVPCGRLGRKALDGAGVEVEPASYEENVKAVVSRVTLGEADAGIVYETDVRAAGNDAEGVDLQLADPTLEAAYAAAVTRHAANVEGGAAWVRFVIGEEGQAVLRDFGFRAP